MEVRMQRVRVHPAHDLKWVVPGEIASAEVLENMSDGEKNSHVGMHEMGNENSLQLFEVKLEPNTEIKVHSHDVEEIIYVVSGTMCLGNRKIGPGSSVYIDDSTFYGFASGEDGLHYLNFRPRSDTSFRLPPSRGTRTSGSGTDARLTDKTPDLSTATPRR
jgi:quercetin dioxygenase-like cupin family protein